MARLTPRYLAIAFPVWPSAFIGWAVAESGNSHPWAATELPVVMIDIASFSDGPLASSCRRRF